MALHTFKVSGATFGGVELSDAEVAVVYDDPIVGNFGLWTATGALTDDDATLPREATFEGTNEHGGAVEGFALLQVISGSHGNPIKVTGRGPLKGEPPRPPERGTYTCDGGCHKPLEPEDPVVAARYFERLPDGSGKGYTKRYFGWHVAHDTSLCWPPMGGVTHDSPEYRGPFKGLPDHVLPTR